MKRILVFVIFAIVGSPLFSVARASLRESLAPGQETSSARQRSTRKRTAPATQPIKVLLRGEEEFPYRGQLSAFETEVVMFIVHVAVAEDSRPTFKSLVQLRSGGGITVERDSIADREKRTWKLNPADFDFLVKWRRGWEGASERSSRSEPLQVYSSETWSVEKSSDPSLTKTWEVSSYRLTGGLEYAPISTAALARQVQTVIVPARAPVLKALRAFISNNR